MERNRLIAVASAALLLYSAAGLPETAEAAVGGMRAPRMTAPRMNAPRLPTRIRGTIHPNGQARFLRRPVLPLRRTARI